MHKFFTNSFEIKADKENKRTMEFIASKEVADRDNEIIKIKGIDLKNYKKNPIILWSHNRNDLPIGKATRITKSGDTLKMKVQFADYETNPFADQVYRLLKGGYLNATSIGFMPDYEKVEYNEKKRQRIFNKVELFELSIVNVPANQEALATGKSINKAFEDGVITSDELEAWTSETPETEKDLIDKIAALEQEIKKLKEELNEDTYFEKLFEEFKSADGTSNDPEIETKGLDLNKEILK